jgi:hypothetical protein
MKCKSKFCDLDIGHLGKCRKVTNEPLPVTNGETPVTNILRPEYIKVYAWRERNRELYRARQREYMRRRRAGSA